MATGKLNGITDHKTLEHTFPDMWQDLHGQNEQQEVNLALGREKEGFGMLAMKALMLKLPNTDFDRSDDVVRETGFTPCTAHRYATLIFVTAVCYAISELNACVLLAVEEELQLCRHVSRLDVV